MLKRLWRRFWCLHYWEKGNMLDIEYASGYKYRYDCAVCSKRVDRWSGNEPMSGIITNPKYIKKDPRFHASPPVIHFDN